MYFTVNETNNLHYKIDRNQFVFTRADIMEVNLILEENIKRDLGLSFFLNLLVHLEVKYT